MLLYDEIERRHQLLLPISNPWIKRLKELGVSVDALVTPELPKQAQVFMRDGFVFDFADEADGTPVDAMIFLARDAFSDPVDLIAWTPKVNRIASMYRRIALLGEDELLAPRLDDEQALMVHETPLAWLLAGRQGVVIVDPRKAAPILRDAEPLRTHSAAFSLRILTLTTPRSPRVFAPSAKLRAVA